MSWDYENPCIIELTAEQQHIDGLNHVNNAVYVNWCEEAAWNHSVSLGFGLEAFQKLDCAFAIRRSEYDYLLPTTLGETVQVATWITECDARFKTVRSFQMIRPSDGAILLRAKWQLIPIGIASARPIRMPKEFANVYGGAVQKPCVNDEV